MLGGKIDWRLPNKNELISIVDYSKSSEVFLKGFEKKSSDTFWSSTISADDADNTWNINFGFCGVSYNINFDDGSVCCVQGGLYFYCIFRD